MTWLKSAPEPEGSEKLRQLYRNRWKEDSDQKISSGCGQIYRFVREIRTDDIILSPTTKRTVLISTIVGDYYLSKEEDECDFRQRREARWIREVFRDNLSARALLRKLERTTTLFFFKYLARASGRHALTSWFVCA